MERMNVLEFIVACTKELTSRFGITLELANIEAAGQDPEFKDAELDPEAFKRAAQAMKRYAPKDDQAIFDDATQEATPSRFVDLIAACFPGGVIDKQHVLHCRSCSGHLASVVSTFFVVLTGGKAEDLDEAADMELIGKLAGACAESIRSLQPYVSWSTLMLKPEYVVNAARAVDGLSPEQGAALLSTVFTLMSHLRETPKVERFVDILKKARTMVEAGRIK